MVDSVTLVRRFDPEQPGHVLPIAVDEGTAVRKLRGGALRFDDDGCSVYSIQRMAELGIGLEAVAKTPYVGLATTNAGRVRAVSSGLADGELEFDVLASPLDAPPSINPAHHSIVALAAYSSRSRRRQAIAALADRAFEILDSPVPPEPISGAVLGATVSPSITITPRALTLALTRSARKELRERASSCVLWRSCQSAWRRLRAK